MPYLGRTGDISETRLNGEELLFEWRIYNFSALFKIHGGWYESPGFKFSNASWRFDLYPFSAEKISFEESVTLELIRVDDCPPMTIQYAIAIKGAKEGKLRKEEKHEFMGSFSSITIVFSRYELNNLMPTSLLIFSCKLRIVAPNPASGGEEFQKSLQKLLLSGVDSDVTLKVQGKEFRAHRAILRVRSPVFEAMFTHKRKKQNRKTQTEKQKGVVTVQDCDSEYFSDFLEHVYTGSVDMISMSNVVSLYTSSEKYDLNTLKKACTDFMKKYLSVASFCNTISLAVKHGEKDLIERATAFFCNNTLKIVETSEWQTFLQENSSVGNELFIKKIKQSR